MTMAAASMGSPRQSKHSVLNVLRCLVAGKNVEIVVTLYTFEKMIIDDLAKKKVQTDIRKFCLPQMNSNFHDVLML